MTTNIKILVAAFLASIFSAILTPFVISKFEINPQEPALKTYRSDEASFLKTFYLMKEGNSYYSSYEIARTSFAAGGTVQEDVFTWRFPTIFSIWATFFDTGEQILNFFIITALICLYCSYLISKRITGSYFAILSPVLLFFYIMDGLSLQLSFLHAEWWGLFFFLIGSTFFAYKHLFGAFIFFSLAVLTRELFVLPLIFMLIFSLIRRDKMNLLTIGTPLFLFVMMYFYHQNNILNHLHVTHLSQTAGQRFHQFNFRIFQQMISYAMRNFVILGLKTHYLFLIAGIISLVIAAIKSDKARYILFGICAFILLLPLIGVDGNDYWGIVFVPLILISTPFWAIFLKHENSNT